MKVRTTWLLLCAPGHGLLCAPPHPRVRHLQRAVEDDGLVVSEATSVAEVLEDFWGTVVRSYGTPSTEATAMVFSCDALKSPAIWSALFEHLECAKDDCDYFGTRVVAVPSSDGDDRALVLKPFGSKNNDDDDDDDDDDWDLSPDLLAKLQEADEIEPEVPQRNDLEEDRSPEAITTLSKKWVDAVVSGAGVCPFSVNAEKAGLPIGGVRYEVSDAEDAEEVYAKYWSEVATLLRASEKDIATTLFILTHPRWTNSLEAFETLGTTLTQALETGKDKPGLGLEADLQLVYFHPRYVFRDGQDRVGEAAAMNYARRSPYPMINILRTSQVKNAQRGIPVALVYKQNEDILASVGADVLEDMLTQRDWAALGQDGHLRVDRSTNDLLRLATSLQQQQKKASSADDAPVPGPAASLP